MKKINIIKIVLDIIMTVAFLLLFNKNAIYGLTFHEIAGLAIGGIFLVHILLNGRWVKQVTAKIFSRGIQLKTRIGYLIDVLLLLCMIYIIVSGILISRVVFPNINIGNEMFFRVTHTSAAYISLLLAGVHLGLHWGWVMNTVTTIFRITHKKKIFGYAAKILAVIILLSGIYSIYSTNYFKKLGTTVNAITGVQKQAFDRGLKPHPDREDGSFEGRSENGKGLRGGSGGERGHFVQGKGMKDINPLSILATYISILSVFTILTYYIEKLLRVRRRQASAIL